jgi:hypothetical protein
MIVTYRHRRKRPVKAKAQPEIKVPRIVTTIRGKRVRPERAPDPEGDARVAAFFKRVIVPYRP